MFRNDNYTVTRNIKTIIYYNCNIASNNAGKFFAKYLQCDKWIKKVNYGSLWIDKLLQSYDCSHG